MQPRDDGVLENLAVGLLSGVLLAVPFLLPGVWWLHYVALVPWVLLVTRPAVRRTWLYVLVGGYTFYIMAFGPLSLFHKAVPFILAILYAPFFVPFAVLLRHLYERSRWPLTVLVPVVWVAAEWLRIRFSIGEIGLFSLGSSQFSRTTLIQIADLTGVYGVSFLVAAANGAVADAWRWARAWRQSGRRQPWRTIIPVAVYPVLLLGVLGYGATRRSALRLTDGPRLAVVQPNAVHYRDARRAFATFEQQISFTRAAVAPGSADMIAWPENAIGEPFGDDPRYLEGLRALARGQRAHVLLGAFTRAATAPGNVHTSAYYLDTAGAVLGRYDKVHLIPWAEYVPFSGGLRRLNAALATSLLGYTSRGVPGREVVVFPIQAGFGMYQFAVPICFEVSSSGFARAAAARGAHFLVNITSEGLLGPPMYVQMLAHSTLRAVEHRLAVVRVANNGLSGVIDPAGRARLLRGESGAWLFRAPGAFVDRVPVNAAGSGTFYTRYGDWLVYFCAGATLLLLVLMVLRNRASAASAPVADRRP